MECIQCNNCKTGDITYFCLSKNDFITDKSSLKVIEKTRDGWKKGDPRYEVHRRKIRKEHEI